MANKSVFLLFAVMAVVSCIVAVEGKRRDSRVNVFEAVERNETCRSPRFNFVFFKRFTGSGMFNRVRANEKKCVCFLANYQYCGTGVQESSTSTTTTTTTTTAAPTTTAAAETTTTTAAAETTTAAST